MKLQDAISFLQKAKDSGAEEVFFYTVAECRIDHFDSGVPRKDLKTQNIKSYVGGQDLLFLLKEMPQKVAIDRFLRD